jgi:hypothetical protein
VPTARRTQYERARVIYKFALDHLPKAKAEVCATDSSGNAHMLTCVCRRACARARQEMFNVYAAFEKKYGTRETVEDVILAKRRFQYEEVRATARRNVPGLPVAVAARRQLTPLLLRRSWASTPTTTTSGSTTCASRSAYGAACAWLLSAVRVRAHACMPA